MAVGITGILGWPEMAVFYFIGVAMSKMNKQDLIAAIAETANLTKAAATEALNAMTSTVTETLKEGGEVVLTGWGKFSSSERAARVGRSPADGSEIQIPAATVAKFKAGQMLKDELNGRS